MSLIGHDMDGDGDPDVLLSDRKPPGSGVKWLENPESSTGTRFWKAHLIGGQDEEVMFIDLLPGDDLESMRIAAAIKPNLLAGWAPGGTNDDWFELDRYEISNAIGGAKAAHIADIDLDGNLDIVFTCEAAVDGKTGVAWFERNSDGKTIEHNISGPEGIKIDRMELLDLDADGDLDVITCEERDNLGVIWYENPAR
jgi:hypothetical protein